MIDYAYILAEKKLFNNPIQQQMKRQRTVFLYKSHKYKQEKVN